MFRVRTSLSTRAISIALSMLAIDTAALGAEIQETSRTPPEELQEPAVEISILQQELFEKSLRAAGEALQFYGAHDDREELERVARIGYSLAAISDFRDYPFTFFLIDMPEPNAFALPGGQIFVTRGMLDLGLDDDMLASLLGHELAHVIHRHGTRMRKRATLLNILSQTLLVGILIGVDDSTPPPRNPYAANDGSRKGSLVQGAAATGVVVSELLLRNYSREFEDEADVEGQRLAAGAGFDPLGGERLWAVMNERIPQSDTYGYWQTHPFARQRMRAARVRAEDLKIQTEKSAESYRKATQKALIEFAERPPRKQPKKDSKNKTEEGQPVLELPRFARSAALTAWPRGTAAEQIRLEELHLKRERLIAEDELERDYGALLLDYERQHRVVAELTSDSPLLATLDADREQLEQQLSAIYPKALAIWQEGVYQTNFLATYLSNYPETEEAGAVALKLGDAYSRTGKQTQAVDQYLAAHESTEHQDQALRGLQLLAPRLDQLTALQRLHEEVNDAELEHLAGSRLATVSTSFEELENGATFLHAYPDNPYAEDVRLRLDQLARERYGEVLLLRSIGDHLQALQKIQDILTHAPFSTAAESLRDTAVFEG